MASILLKKSVNSLALVGVEETISYPKRTVKNLNGTLNVVGALSPEHVALFGSSADVYGAHSSLLRSRMHRRRLLPVSKCQSKSMRSDPHVKALEENLITNSEARSVVIRVFNTYGPAMDFPAPKRVDFPLH